VREWIRKLLGIERPDKIAFGMDTFFEDVKVLDEILEETNMVLHEVEGQPHQDCGYHVVEEFACYCQLEGTGQARDDLPCYECYHGFMTEDEVREMDD
jgi:hypothetical protein